MGSSLSLSQGREIEIPEAITPCDHRKLAFKMLHHVQREAELAVFKNRKFIEAFFNNGGHKSVGLEFCVNDPYFDAYLKNLHPVDRFKVFDALRDLFKQDVNRDPRHTLDYEFTGQLPLKYLILIIEPSELVYILNMALFMIALFVIYRGVS